MLHAITSCFIEPQLWPLKVLRGGNSDFRPFSFCDPMTFIYELVPYSLEIYGICQYEIPMSRFSKVMNWETDRQTDRHDRNYISRRLQVVNDCDAARRPCIRHSSRQLARTREPAAYTELLDLLWTRFVCENVSQITISQLTNLCKTLTPPISGIHRIYMWVRSVSIRYRPWNSRKIRCSLFLFSVKNANIVQPWVLT